MDTDRLQRPQRADISALETVSGVTQTSSVRRCLLVAMLGGCASSNIEPEPEPEPEPDCTVSTEWRWLERGPVTHLPFAARKMVPWWGELVVTAFDERGIAVVPFHNARATSLLKVHSAPTGFSISFDSHLVWVERAIPGIGGPWLFDVDLRDPSLAIREIPFPVPNARDAIMVTSEEWSTLRLGIVTRDLEGLLHWTRFDGETSVPQSSIPIGRAPAGDQYLALWRAYTSNQLVHVSRQEQGSELLVFDEETRTVVEQARLPHVLVDATLAGTDLVMLDEQRRLYLRTEDGSERHVLDLPFETQQVRGNSGPHVVSCTPGGEISVLQLGAGCARRMRIAEPATACAIAEMHDEMSEYYAFGTTVVNGYPMLDL